MSKVAQYLQEHLLGEVTASTEVRRHFSTDASILHLAPAIVAYPRNENDIRKATRFSWQLAQRGRLLPITARGGGSDTSGAAIGSGVLLAFSAHMNRILALDPAKELLTVEPGATYDKLEQTLYTHGQFLPPYPASLHYATIGGGLANNASGEKTVKYGLLRDYVKQLRVVLANGEVIEVGPLTKRELSKKLGLASFEGEIYRALDGLLEENAELIKTRKSKIASRLNNAGYNIFDIKNSKDKTFDLTPLFLGSQGTLGIITEASLRVVEHNPISKTAMISLYKLDDINSLIPKIMELKPSVFDMVTKSALDQIRAINPHQLGDLLEAPNAQIHLFVEFDDQKDAHQRKQIKRLAKLVVKVGGVFRPAFTPEDQEKIAKIRQSVGTVLTQPHGQSKAIPVAEDICVPVSRYVEFLLKASEIYTACGLVPAAWGHVGDGTVRMHPVLDLAQIGDRQKLFKLSEAIYKVAVTMGGSISASAGDGRMRAPYLNWMYGPELTAVMMQVKKIFDPLGILNPGVKTASTAEIKALMRGEYNLGHHHQHLPRN
jgi:FAD/FMN-containing dehydrogenase